MTEFGKQLRKFRQQCNDTKSPHGRLTQERFGELVGAELGISYSGVTISDWERGVSKIHADQRPVLVSIIKVLHRWDGIETSLDANQLLEAGHYRALDATEIQKIFGEATSNVGIERSKLKSEILKSCISFLLENIFAVSDKEFQVLIAKAEEGPYPSWPRVLAAFMRKACDRWSLSISSIFWTAVWLIAWWLIPPSLRWPFVDRDAAYSAIVMYVGGTLAVPLLVGLLITTKDSEYWKQQGLSNSALLRLYTYQGAGIGFNLGYFFVFPLVLVRYYLQLGSSIWLELAAITLGLLLANMSARVVPYNLWLAYRRLHFADGAIFFVVALLGPLWGLFFFEFYSIFLTPFVGVAVILLALMLIVIMAKRQSSKKIDIKQEPLDKQPPS